jgi:hypothetical protein
MAADYLRCSRSPTGADDAGRVLPSRDLSAVACRAERWRHEVLGREVVLKLGGSGDETVCEGYSIRRAVSRRDYDRSS